MLTSDARISFFLIPMVSVFLFVSAKPFGLGTTAYASQRLQNAFYLSYFTSIPFTAQEPATPRACSNAPLRFVVHFDKIDTMNHVNLVNPVQKFERILHLVSPLHHIQRGVFHAKLILQSGNPNRTLPGVKKQLPDQKAANNPQHNR